MIMIAIESIINYYQNKRKGRTPLKLCPNCWGHQRYQGKFLNKVKRDDFNLKKVGERRGWMLAYVSSKLLGFRIKKNLTW